MAVGFRIVLIISVMGVLVAGLQIVIWRMAKGKVFFKYIPTLVLLIIVVVCIIKSIWFSTGMEDLAYFITAMLAAGVLTVSLVTGIIIDIVSKPHR
ncbi:MAG: hypothetical protein GX227_04380 [Clostridiaceae bacterium]|jgi:hypothetical protein|nr:hypothetical protein [Clostridiaceae bacterium]